MASLVYHFAIAALMKADIDLDADDIRVALLMTNTTADTDADAEDLADIGTLDECDSTGYARVALASEAVNVDDTNDRAEFDANDASFTGLGGDATRDIQGALIYKHVDGTAANDVCICFVDFTADISSAATQIDVPWNAEGILQGASA